MKGMYERKQRRLAVIGAGPVGVEAALEGHARGWDVTLYEAGEGVGTSVRSWAHVPLFTPWGMVRGPRGEAVLRREGLALADAEASLTGGHLLEQYLEPLAEQEPLAEMLESGQRVAGITRRRKAKTHAVGDPRRAEEPFLLRIVDGAGREGLAEAEAVLDCSGVRAEEVGLGPGGGPALGEAALQGTDERAGILRRIPDLEGEDRTLFAGRRVLLLGSGHSAANAIVSLAELARQEEDTRVVWAWRRDVDPYPCNEEDPLPLRRRLEERAAVLAQDPPAWLTVLPGHVVRSLYVEGAGQAARLAGQAVLEAPDGTQKTLGTDVLVGLVGQAPDLTLARELQVHTCHATEGPMALSASLLEASGDCMEQPPPGAETLRTTEPGYLVLGRKSYGRKPAFLLRDGYGQVSEAFALLEEVHGAATATAEGALR